MSVCDLIAQFFLALNNILLPGQHYNHNFQCFTRVLCFTFCAFNLSVVWRKYFFLNSQWPEYHSLNRQFFPYWFERPPSLNTRLPHIHGRVSSLYSVALFYISIAVLGLIIGPVILPQAKLPIQSPCPCWLVWVYATPIVNCFE